MIALLAACKPAPPAVHAPSPLARQLAGARLDAARAAIAGGKPAQGLLLLVSSLKADPTFADAVREIRPLLARTQWSYPAARIDAGLPVEQTIVSGDSVWTSIADRPGGFNTTARWNLGTLAVEAVLFPRRGETTGMLLLSPDGGKLVVTRGNGRHQTTLLCDARTLKPVRTLQDRESIRDDPAALPHFFAFSSDNLLFADPEPTAKGTLWNIRDLSRGEILRSHETPSSQPVRTTTLDRTGLHLHLADNTTLTIPISPTDEPFLSDLPEAPGPAPASRPPSGTSTLGSEIELTRLLPLPKTTGRAVGPLNFDPQRLPSLGWLAEALAGLHFDEDTRTFTPLDEARRRAIVAYCHHPDSLLDGLDFTNVVESIVSIPFRRSASDAAFLLNDRIASADTSGPRYLALHINPPKEPTPAEAITTLFQSGDDEKIVAAIRDLPLRSQSAATAFRLSLESDNPSWITACLETFKPLPPLLADAGLSHLAWTRGHKAEAIAIWNKGFPDPEVSRRTEDWNGWESADFTPVLEKHFAGIRQELASYEPSPDASPEQRASLAARLLDPAAAKSIGKDRHAAACLAAARASADFPEEAEDALKLLTLARALGASPSECLRAEASVHTSAGDFAKAHECWISLITDFAPGTHEARDYAEAAYTAFENGDGEQAMAILGTGLTRFPEDSDFAYRAGWISLLTARYQEAYEFLLVADRIGFAEEKFEKALAMLAIAASATKDREHAVSYFEELVDLNPEWSQPDPPKAEGWPQELKSILFEISAPPKAVPVEE